MKTIGRHIRNVQSHLFMRMSLTTTEGLEELSKNEGQRTRLGNDGNYKKHIYVVKNPTYPFSVARHNHFPHQKQILNTQRKVLLQQFHYLQDLS